MKMFKGKIRKGRETEPCSFNNYWVLRKGDTFKEAEKELPDEKEGFQSTCYQENQETTFFKERKQLTTERSHKMGKMSIGFSNLGSHW